MSYWAAGFPSCALAFTCIVYCEWLLPNQLAFMSR